MAAPPSLAAALFVRPMLPAREMLVHASLAQGGRALLRFALRRRIYSLGHQRARCTAPLARSPPARPVQDLLPAANDLRRTLTSDPMGGPPRRNRRFAALADAWR